MQSYFLWREILHSGISFVDGNGNDFVFCNVDVQIRTVLDVGQPIRSARIWSLWI